MITVSVSLRQIIFPKESKPTVSVGLPVYNGEQYLEQAIQSILAQTYSDFELIISDNASTDRTPEICQKYAAQDARIRYNRTPTNIGGANNHNLVFRLSKGKYFRWAAYDDIYHPELIEKCVRVLDSDSAIVLCHPTNVHIDGEGLEIGIVDRFKAQSNNPYERFRELTSWDHDCEEIYGLIRSESLTITGLQRNYTDQDRTLLCHLSLLGRFHHIPESLFYKRIHDGMSTKQYPDWHQRMLWFDEKNQNRPTFPHWLQFFHYLEIIATSSISIMDKILCYLHMVHWLFEYRRWGKMGKDIIYAGRSLFHFHNNNQ